MTAPLSVGIKPYPGEPGHVAVRAADASIRHS
jgi:hypothetical protein